MEINKEVSVKLTVKELEQIVKDHLKREKGLNIESVYFNVSGHEDPTDWQSRYPLTYELDGVTCKGELS